MLTEATTLPAKRTETVSPLGVDSRQTVEQRFNEILTMEGTLGEKATAANEFLYQIRSDIALITGRRVGQATGAVSAEPGWNRHFQGNFKTLLDNLKAKKDKTVEGVSAAQRFPIGQVSLFTNEAKEASFTMLLNDHKVHTIRMRNVSVRCPLDFSRSIPSHAQGKLAALGATHFDYQPKILDGELIEDTAEDQRPFSLFMDDPALVIKVADNLYAVDHWREPYASSLQRKCQWFFQHPNWDLVGIGVSALVALVIFFFICGIGVEGIFSLPFTVGWEDRLGFSMSVSACLYGVIVGFIWAGVSFGVMKMHDATKYSKEWEL